MLKLLNIPCICYAGVCVFLFLLEHFQCYQLPAIPKDKNFRWKNSFDSHGRKSLKSRFATKESEVTLDQPENNYQEFPEPLKEPQWSSKFLTIQGVQVHYKDTGPPPTSNGFGYKTLVMLHGFAGSTACWDDISPSLSDKYRIIAFDRPAFGLTERPTIPLNMPWQMNMKTLGEDPYAIDFSVKLVWRLLDRLRVSKAILVGHSLGCQLATRAAQARPRRAQGVVLIAPAIMNAFDEISGQGAGQGEGGVLGKVQDWAKEAQTAWGYARFIGAVNVPRLGLQQVRESILSGPDIYERVGRNFYNPEKVTEEMVNKYQRPLEEENWDLGLVYFYRASQGDWEPGAQFLRKVQERWSGPALVIAGDHDMTCPAEKCEKVSQILGCEYKLINMSGHNIPDEHPGRISKYLDEFTSQIL